MCDLVATGWLGGGERVVGPARSIALPGVGFVEWQPLLASFTIVAAIGVLVLWLQWGADWSVVAVWTIAAAVTWWVVPLHHDVASSAPGTLRVLRASHEFAVVLVVLAAIGRMRVAFSSLPGFGARSARRAADGTITRPVLVLNAVDRSRAAALNVLAGGDAVASIAELRSPEVIRRAVRIGRVARGRFRGDPLRADHAAVRAGLVLAGGATPAEVDAFRVECHRRRAGVPGSEPTWVRLLDGTLAALALDHLGEHECVDRWRQVHDRHFALRHGRRRGALHTPSMLTIGTAPPWEHATATALTRHAGWIGDDDWQHLRRRCLGAAARGANTAEDARLVAAGRVWARLVGDAEAARILRRPTLALDELAHAIDRLADGLAT